MSGTFQILCTSLQRACVTVTKRQLATARRAQEGPVSMTKKPKTYLIVGLGNHDLPNTRHSVGMRVLDRLADYLHMDWKPDVKNCVGCVSSSLLTDDIRVVLLKPKMPMNVNGTSVARTASYFDILPENVYLIHDDIDKSLGKVWLKDSGSACGHNGVRSVIHSLGTDDIPRVRIGIDRPPSKNQVKDYVLSDFTPEETSSLNVIVDDCLHTLAQHLAKKSGAELPEPLKTQIKKT